jgi:myosin heavy subunit
LERIEHMEEQSSATTCSNDSTEEMQQLQEMVVQLRQALQQSQQTVREKTTEHQSMQSTIDALKEELNTHKVALDEKNRQLDETLAQNDEIALRTKLLRLRVDDLESQRNTLMEDHSLAVEQARQEGKRAIQARLTFWMQQYHVLETTTVALAHEQRQAALNSLEMCQEEKFELRYAWHLARERDRAVVLRRQLQWQTYVMEPYEWVTERVVKPSLEWLSVQPAVVDLLRKWDTLAHKHVPQWTRRTTKWISVTYQDAIEPRVSEWWYRVLTTRQQVEQFYNSVVAPLPVVQSVMASHAAVIHGAADLLTIMLQSNMPPFWHQNHASSRHGLPWVQEHATQLIMGVEAAFFISLVAYVFLFRRRSGPKKP